MFHVVTNVETLETEKFLVVLVFGKDGHMIDACCPVYKDVVTAADFIKEVLKTHGQLNSTGWTSNKELYTEFLNVPGLGVEYKHVNETSVTKSYVDTHKDILTEFHQIAPLIPLPKLPKWRKWLLLCLEKITNKLRGEGYEV